MAFEEKKTERTTDVWLTPKPIIDALGPFDLDPCAAIVRPYDCAMENLTEVDDGLRADWRGLVWLNPPYSENNYGKWFAKLIEHRNGICLTFARTETFAMQTLLGEADAVLFPFGRIAFCRVDGVAVPGTGAPSMFTAFGLTAVSRLLNSGIKGTFFFKGRAVGSDVQKGLPFAVYTNGRELFGEAS